MKTMVQFENVSRRYNLGLTRTSLPTAGNIQVNGKLSAIIELGAGFHNDLTGRESIFLNGTILGLVCGEIEI